MRPPAGSIPCSRRVAVAASAIGVAALPSASIQGPLWGRKGSRAKSGDQRGPRVNGLLRQHDTGLPEDRDLGGEAWATVALARQGEACEKKHKVVYQASRIIIRRPGASNVLRTVAAPRPASVSSFTERSADGRPQFSLRPGPHQCARPRSPRHARGDGGPSLLVLPASLAVPVLEDLKKVFKTTSGQAFIFPGERDRCVGGFALQHAFAG